MIGRYLKWTFHCRRGRLCANLTVDPIQDPDNPYPYPPAGFGFIVEYTCGGCGTRYRTTVESLGDGRAVNFPRERARA